jgi:chemotaxis protein histidine kinase CheA
MSEHEKLEQVGRLTEEVSHLRGQLNQINEKLARAYGGYMRLGQSTGPNYWTLEQGEIKAPSSQHPGNKPPDFTGLLSHHDLIEVLEHRKKLTDELKEASDRLTKLAPHIF